MDVIIMATFLVTAIGAVCAVILCTASKLMYVKVDERVAKIQECLPGMNCGACGFPGCAGYAISLVSDAKVKNNLCTPGGAETLTRLSKILGVEAGDVVAKIAVVQCRGDKDVRQRKMEYKGIQTCVAAKQIFGGEGACTFGCLGYGDCRLICPSGAICLENGLARINPRLCTGCGLCVKTCPNKLIAIEKKSIAVAVLCKNIEKGAVARKKCSNCCLGCGKCARECSAGAIIVKDNLAEIDYEKCTGCGHCADICVSHCIQSLSY